ncbi:MAG TPA: hypothetical protein VIH37_02065, partial [Candidatus Limnocylindrales bacterium]
MTDQERDAAAAGGAGDDTEDDAAGGEELEHVEAADEIDEGDEQAEPEEEEFEGEEFEDEEPATAVPAGAVAAPPARGRRLRGQPKTVAAPRTASERAVKVDDRFSGWYVIAVVTVFALIFVNAVFFGHGGFVSGFLATPTPTIAPTASAAPTSAAPTSAAP